VFAGEDTKDAPRRVTIELRPLFRALRTAGERSGYTHDTEGAIRLRSLRSWIGVCMPAFSRAAAGSLVFPNHRDVIAEDARRFRGIDAADRWREIFALRNWGARITQGSARGDSIRRLEADQESQWQAIQKDLLARHDG